MTGVQPMPASSESGARRIQHGPFETFYHQAGSGRPVLLIHGSGPGVSALANWQTLLASALSVRYQFLAPDVVGFGATHHTGSMELSHDTRVSQLIGFLDALKLNTVDVVGNSMGGGLALSLAHRYPERIRRMVLMGTVGISFPITPGLDAVWGYTPSPENVEKIFKLFAYDRGLITEDLVRQRYEASAVPDVHQRYSQAFAAPRQRHIDAMALAEDELATIQTPTLLVHGRDDQIIPLSDTSLRLLQILPNADLVVFGRCGHWTQIERAADFQRHIDGFFAS